MFEKVNEKKINVRKKLTLPWTDFNLWRGKQQANRKKTKLKCGYFGFSFLSL